MAKLEKRLYKEVVVPSSHKTEKVVSGPYYIGFSTTNPARKSTTVYDYECVKQDIINHFHIRQGEKLSDPTFGTIIWDLLFEPFTDNIKDAIIKNVTDIVNFDPRTRASGVQVSEYESGLQTECTIMYLDYNISESLKMQFDKNVGLA